MSSPQVTPSYNNQPNILARLRTFFFGGQYNIPQLPSNFYPANAAGMMRVNLMYGNTSPILVDTTYGTLWRVYMGSPLLRIVIDRGAEMFSNADVYVKDKDGKRMEKHPLNTLLKKPTPLQGREDWLKWWYIMDCIYSNTFISPITGMRGVAPAAMWVLPSYDIEIVPTGKLYKQSKVEDIISSYKMISTKETYKVNEIIHMVTNAGEVPFLGESNIPSLQYPISNSNAALKTRNVNLTRSGPKGIISADASNSENVIPFGDKERERVTNELLNNYGIDEGQSPIAATMSTIKFVPVTLPLKELMTSEELDESFGMMCGKYGMARDLFPSAKGATYENTKQAQVATYQSTIQPKADSLAGRLTEWFTGFGVLKEGETIYFDYSWIPVLQENKKEEADTLKTNADTVKSLIDSNVINPAQGSKMFSQITGIMPDETLASSSKVIAGLTEISPLVANKFADTMTVDEQRQELGLPALGGDIGGKLVSQVSKPQTAAPQQP